MRRRIARWGGRLDAALSFAELAFVGAAMALSSLLLFANVVLRYVFLAPISWAEELSIYAVIWIVFVGGSAVVRLRGHLAIDLLPKLLSPAGRRLLVIFVLLASLGFFAVFCYFSGLHTLRVQAAGQLTPNMQAPMWLTYLAMPVGAALMFLRTSQLLWREVRDERAADPVAQVYD